MVKKLIKGLLKKKEAAPPPQQAAAPEEDIPDELPPLAEDVAEEATKAPEKPAAPPPATPAEAPKEPPKEVPPAAEKPVEPPKEKQKGNVLPTGDEAPDELPSLDFEKKAAALDLRTDEEKEAAKKEEAQKEVEKKTEKSPEPKEHKDMPDEIKKARAAKEGEKPAEHKELPKLDDLKTLSAKLETSTKLGAEDTPSSESGFFSNLLEHVKKEDSTKEKLLAGDLYARMSNYWDLKKHEIKTGTTASTEQHLESEMVTVLEELKTLEFKWQRQKLALEEDLKFLEQREREIKNKTDELRRVANELAMFKNVKPEEYFRLRNGVLLKNMHDLVDMLEIMDDATFTHHVSGRKNDFADWIKHVFTDKHLSEGVKSSKSRAEMIDTLLEHPVMKLRERKIKKRLHPAQYFFLANGVVIKSAAELSDALKAMDDKLFQKHVDLEKNDFAAWLKKVVREPELAAHIEKAHTKKEMIAALDIYL